MEEASENNIPGDTRDDETDARITVKEKWQGAVTEGSGFVAVPMALLRLQSAYDLSATDMLVLINLLAHWWDPDKAVYPRNTIIAKRMGVETRTVQRSLHKLCERGLVHRFTMPDGKRAFSFDTLARRLSRDLPQALYLHLGERAALRRR